MSIEPYLEEQPWDRRITHYSDLERYQKIVSEINFYQSLKSKLEFYTQASIQLHFETPPELHKIESSLHGETIAEHLLQLGSHLEDKKSKLFEYLRLTSERSPNAFNALCHFCWSFGFQHANANLKNWNETEKSDLNNYPYFYKNSPFLTHLKVDSYTTTIKRSLSRALTIQYINITEQNHVRAILEFYWLKGLLYSIQPLIKGTQNILSQESRRLLITHYWSF